MEDDKWSFGRSTSSSRNHLAELKSQYGFCVDFDEIEEEEEEEEEEDDDDEYQAEYPCPFCPYDLELIELCSHINDEHHLVEKIGFCPVCSTKVEMNMVGHITTHHADIIKIQHRLKLLTGQSDQSYSSLRKELEDLHFHSLLAGSSPPISHSREEPDPLLSFIYNAPTKDRYETVQPESTVEASIEEESSEEKILEKNLHSTPLSDKDQLEKSSRCEFAQGLLLSTIFEGDW